MSFNYRHITLFLLAGMATALTSCGYTGATSTIRPVVSVSLPVEAYFVSRIASDAVEVNVLIPQAAGHSDYSPRPSQMMQLASSSAYLAIGSLDFELTWRDRMISSSPQMKWVDLSQGIEMITDNDNHDDLDNDHEGHHHHATDPHYWLAPRQAKVMATNIAKALKDIEGVNHSKVDSSLAVLNAQLSAVDSTLASLASGRSISFMIYHPALTYMARDYGMKQMEIEKDGNAPSPQTYMQQISSARADSVRVVFVQQGYDLQKAKQAAEMLGAKVVQFTPEGYDWPQTINTIVNALAE